MKIRELELPSPFAVAPMAGMTDTAIAYHLGVSDRTVRRRIKDLMAELRVDSRFAAGVKAAERGWI